MSATTFDTFNAARARESAGVERVQAEATASAIGAQHIRRVGPAPLATKPELHALTSDIAVLRWAIGIYAAITVATLALVCARLF